MIRYSPLVALIALATVQVPLAAQAIPFSQHGTVTQRVALTDITIIYNRPTARGRVLFPNVVKFGQVWNPGADSASRIAFSHNVRLNGASLPAGEYSVWLIPAEQGPWTLIFNTASQVFHTPYPGNTTDVLRLPVTPERGEHMEALAFYFPAVMREKATLRIHWGTTVISVAIETPAPQGE